jgi:hypothetical protein
MSNAIVSEKAKGKARRAAKAEKEEEKAAVDYDSSMHFSPKLFLLLNMTSSSKVHSRQRIVPRRENMPKCGMMPPCGASIDAATACFLEEFLFVILNETKPHRYIGQNHGNMPFTE